MKLKEGKQKGERKDQGEKSGKRGKVVEQQEGEGKGRGRAVREEQRERSLKVMGRKGEKRIMKEKEEETRKI